MKIKCFEIVPNGKWFTYLRRYKSSSEGDVCPSTGHSHDAMTQVEDIIIVPDSRGYYMNPDEEDFGRFDEYPKKCECGYEFKQEDTWQVHTKEQYVRKDGTNDEVYHLWKPPVGAIWDATWMHDVKSYCGPDGRSLHCQTPGGEWCIDSRASNCTMPKEDTHKCWVRHGEIENMTVDKIGNTCQAGAGSILCGSYHGFLRDGYLVD